MLRGSTKEPMAFFSNLGSAYVAAHQRRAGVDRLRRAGAEAVQVRRRRAGGRRAADERRRTRPRGRWRWRSASAASACASRWSRTASSRRAPGAASPAGRGRRDRRRRAGRRGRTTSSASSPATRARWSARPTRCPSWPAPAAASPSSRRATTTVVGFGVGRTKDKDVILAETDDGKELPVGPGRFHVTARGGKGHELKRKTQDRARHVGRAAGADRRRRPC